VTTAVSTPRRRPPAVLVLGVLGILTFGLIPIRINTVYSGLPAHPLFLHVPVILIPVVGVAALILAARPAWWVRHGVWVTFVAVVALGSLNLTMGAGKALRADLGVPIAGFGGANGPAELIARHEHAADLLRIFTILLTAVLICALALFGEDGGRPVVGIGFVDGLVARLRSVPALRVLARCAMALLAALCLYFVFHTGDLGARAVWQGRVHSGGGYGGPPGGGGVGSLFGGGGGG
jgi:hypothetical protein